MDRNEAPPVTTAQRISGLIEASGLTPHEFAQRAHLDEPRLINAPGRPGRSVPTRTKHRAAAPPTPGSTAVVSVRVGDRVRHDAHRPVCSHAPAADLPHGCGHATK